MAIIKKHLSSDKRREKRVRAKARGTAERPRLSVFRSNRYIYAQLVDDTEGRTLVSMSSKTLKNSKTKVEQAKEVGKRLAKDALKKGIKKVVFDRGRYKYHGRVKALADGARAEGLEF
jgi:large subunit ribosomal protein L18